MIQSKIHLFTNEFKIIKVLQPQLIIKKIFTENKLLFIKVKKIGYDVILVKSHNDLLKKSISLVEIGISYGFGIIFKKSFLKNYKKGIWNVHPGFLPQYRGRHPITAAFLNDEKKIGISVHIINEKIDRGLLLVKSHVVRNYKDDEFSIKQKLFKILTKVLKKAFQNFEQKKIVKLPKGKYYKPFYKGIKIDNSKKIDYKYIYNAAKAQKSFKGISVNGKIYYDAFFYSLKNLKKKNTNLILCKKNKKIILISKK